jgi:prepilin-type N-terminal cleavage/methylation domain-containing protein
MALEHSPHPTSRRPGLTLVELVVVMAILVALAGILIPLIPGLIGRAETSGRATNSQEIYKAIQTYEASYTHYPSDWDALTDGTTTPLTYVNGFTGSTPPLAVTALTASQSTALNAAGITRLQLMATSPTGTDETFNPYLDPSDRNSTTGSLPITKTSTPNVVTLTTVGQFQLSLADNATTSSGTYVVVGFGKRCSIIGTGAAEAPVNFFDNAGLSPDTRYSRYGVVFQVSGILPQSTSTTQKDFMRAKLVRVFRFGGTLGTGDDAIKSYWDDVSGGNGS